MHLWRFSRPHTCFERLISHNYEKLRVEISYLAFFFFLYTRLRCGCSPNNTRVQSLFRLFGVYARSALDFWVQGPTFDPRVLFKDFGYSSVSCRANSVAFFLSKFISLELLSRDVKIIVSFFFWYRWNFSFALSIVLSPRPNKLFGLTVFMALLRASSKNHHKTICMNVKRFPSILLFWRWKHFFLRRGMQKELCFIRSWMRKKINKKGKKSNSFK